MLNQLQENMPLFSPLRDAHAPRSGDITHRFDFYMGKALAQARRAFAADEVPVGAVLVGPDGTIVAQAYNKVEKHSSQIAHAEMHALQKAGKKLGDWRLEQCWLFVTLEPCAMCMNAILISRLKGLVYAAESPLFGYQKVDKANPSWVYKKDSLAIIGGVCQKEATDLLQQFFKQKRKASHE